MHEHQISMISLVGFVLKVSILGILFLGGKAITQCQVLDDLVENAFVWLTNTRHAKMKKKNYWHTIFGWGMYKSTVHTLFQDLCKTASLGHPAPNPTVCNMDGIECKLLDYQSTGRPLVLVFGSCTCPPFMASLTQLDEVEKVFAHIADFVLVYIDEAHADDEWRFEENHRVTQHKNLQERLRAAQILNSHKPKRVAMLVDTMKNTANKTYAAHPERLYIINKGVVEYEGGIGPFYYNIQEVAQWLYRFRSKQQHMQPNQVFQLSRDGSHLG